MTNNLLLLQYNNYYNRIIKKEESISSYGQAAISSKTLTNYNFNPADNVTTRIIIGTSDINKEYDYVVVYHEVQVSKQVVEYVIDSRWFIIETNRTRDGQYEVILRRDVIADNLDTVLDATTYIEKGTIPVNNPLIFNKEGMTFNQIKSSEELLMDKSNCPWIVGYISKTASQDNIGINYNPANQDFIAVSAANISAWYTSLGIDSSNPTFISDPYDIIYKTDWQAGLDFVYNYRVKTYIYGSGSYYNQNNNKFGNPALRAAWSSNKNTVASNLLNAYNTYGLTSFKSALINLIGAKNTAETTAIKNFNGKIIKTQDGKYYNVSVRSIDQGYTIEDNSLVHGNDLFSLLSAATQLSGVFDSSHNTPDDNSFTYSCKCAKYSVICTENSSFEVLTKIASTRNETTDSICDLFAIPCPMEGTINIHNSDSTVSININKEIAMSAAISITKALSGSIYDVQLLPYCPIQALIDDTGILLPASGEGYKFDYIKDNSTNPASNIGALFYVPESNFTFDIDKQIYWDQYKLITGFTDITELPTPYSTFKENVNYVVQDINTPESATAPVNASITTLDENNNIVNAITCNQINKTTGQIVTSATCARIEVNFNSGTPNLLKCYKHDGTSYSIEWEWTANDYDNANIYLEWTINVSRWGAQNSNLLAAISKIAVYSAQISNAYAYKINNECNLYRLVSPNYQGEFEFSPIKNGGVDRFNVDCTYKPYNPYIHVNPDFGGLYGDDYNDSRGLVCQGDFSLGMLTDAFTQYELQNKNYQQIFNRQIQNMDVSNEIARQEQTFKSISGSVTGGVGGAVAGGMAGGPWGAVAGAVVGTATGITGGIMDYQNLEKKITENRSYAVDMYNYNLQNIQALPYSISRCTALTFNNKLYPFVEMYTCTNEEKEAFIAKLTYDGMTVNKIDKISNYTDMEGRLIRGIIIRFDEATPILKDDYHMAEEIYNEIKKGVYL